MRAERHEHGANCGHGPEVQRSAAVQRSTVHEVLRSPGQALDTGLRTEMEGRYGGGVDFSGVRVHTDAVAQRSAAEIGAKAYTSGAHVVWNGQDKPTLAHELKHYLQQSEGSVPGTDNGSGIKVSSPGDWAEREAEETARQVMSAPVQRAEREPQAAERAGGVVNGSAAGRNQGDRSAVVQRAGGDWKNKKTKAELKNTKASTSGSAIVDTLHHIVPKSDLARLSGLLTSAQRQLVAAQLAPLAPSASFPTGAVSEQALSKALANVPANYVIGPRPEQRTDDPGSSGPDLNRKGGSTTPRSAELQKVYDFITTHKSAAQGSISTTTLQTDFINSLKTACTAHGMAVGLDSTRAGWTQDAASGQWTRES
ncbi:DUF4157 domain-containing protein [Streptomyces sp. NPDC020766]|uniref:eCIS core domain-containing protein n=1 Tax=Streptomyces sp. NPDC020766 TaxID=3155011 RepID=UPI0033F8691B